jgi:hypothetical protein
MDSAGQCSVVVIRWAWAINQILIAILILASNDQKIKIIEFFNIFFVFVFVL